MGQTSSQTLILISHKRRREIRGGSCWDMVKLTVVGRVRDGVALAQGIRYVNEEIKDDVLGFRQQAEFILEEISRGALSNSKMAIHIHHHCFIYLVENGVCYMTLCDSSYPRKLALHYLQDLHKEFAKFDDAVIEKVIKPYSFLKFDMAERSICNTNPQPVFSTIWSSPCLEEIALKWTPMAVTFAVLLVLLWASFILFDISLSHHNEFVIPRKIK